MASRPRPSLTPPPTPSAPQTNPKDSGSRGSLGMFDYHDLVSYIMIVFKKKEWNENEEDIEIKEIVKRALRSEPVQVRAFTVAH
jgi:hypothetical protein